MTGSYTPVSSMSGLSIYASHFIAPVGASWLANAAVAGKPATFASQLVPTQERTIGYARIQLLQPTYQCKRR